MANVNKVMLLGNVTRDLELRYTPKGTAVTDLGLAVNRIRTGDNGERIEEVTYVDVTLWGRTAEIAGQYLQKGRPVFIEGRLQLDSWDDKTTGQKRSKLRVIGENLQLLPSGGGSSGGGGGGGQSNHQSNRTSDSVSDAPRGAEPAEEYNSGGDDEDDIPF